VDARKKKKKKKDVSKSACSPKKKVCSEKVMRDEIQNEHEEIPKRKIERTVPTSTPK